MIEGIEGIEGIVKEEENEQKDPHNIDFTQNLISTISHYETLTSSL